MPAKREITRYVTLSDCEVQEIEDVITYNTLKVWRAQGYNDNARGPYFQDAKQYVWMVCLRALHLGYEREKGVKPASFIRPRVKTALLHFFVAMGWMHRTNLYKGRVKVEMPKRVGLNTKVKHPLKSREVPLWAVLT